MSLLRLAPAVAASLLTFAACSPTPAGGTVMLAVSTNLVPFRDFDSGYVIPASVEGSMDVAVGLNDFSVDTEFPFTFALRAADSKSGQLHSARVRIGLARGGARLRSDGTTIIARDVEFVLPEPGEIQLVHVSLDWLSILEPNFERSAMITDPLTGDSFPVVQPESCTTTLDAAGVCGPGTAVVGGPVDHAVVPYDPKLVFGGGADPADGAATCFSASACFAGSPQTATAKMVGGRCVADGVPPGVNVGVLTAGDLGKNGQPRCPGGCGDVLLAGQPDARGVVLDSEFLQFEDGTLILPDAVCTRFRGGAPLVFSAACAQQKNRTFPLCPETSDALGRVHTLKRIDH